MGYISSLSELTC